jgi:hypothetical protein
MDTQRLDRTRQRNTQAGERAWTATAAAWVLLVAGGCGSDAPTDSGLTTMQPAQTAQPTGGVQAASTPGAAGKSASTSASATGTAGTKVAAGGVGGGSTAGSSASAAAGAAGTSLAVAAGAGTGAGAGSSGTVATAAGASGSAGLPSAGSGENTGAGAGAGQAGAVGGSAGAAGGTAVVEHEDLGKGDGTDVVLIGDSWMSNTLQIEGTGGGIAPALIAVSKQQYRNYGLQGVELLQANTFGPAIPSQWEDAKRANPKIKTVVMTAGGNDVIQGSSTLQSSCQMGTDECKMKLVTISDALDKLWTQMAADGVEDIVHIRYTDNTGTLNPSLQGDNGLPTPKICLSGKVRCHGVTTTDIVAATDLAADGIHPLQAANTKIAQRTTDLMTKEGIRR